MRDVRYNFRLTERQLNFFVLLKHAIVEYYEALHGYYIKLRIEIIPGRITLVVEII